jgi:outer membrane protein
MRARSGLVAALLALAPAALAAQQPASPAAHPKLSLEDALSMARQQNPDYLAQRNDLDVARWSVRTAKADFAPSVSASSSFGYTASGERRFESVGLGAQPDMYSSSYNIGASLDISGSKLLQPKVAKAQERATQQRVAGVEANLEAAVVQEYLAVLQARETLAQSERDVARTAEHVRLAQAKLEVGSGTPLDVRRAEVQKGQAEIRVVQAKSALAQATLALGQRLGVLLPEGVELSSSFAIFQPTWKAEELVERAVRQNPTLLAARASMDAARTGVQSARTAYLPSVRFSTGLSGFVSRAGDLEPLLNQQLNPASFASCQRQNKLGALIGEAPQSCMNPSDPAVRAEVRRYLEDQNSGYPFNYTRQPLSASMTVSLPIFTGLNRQLRVEQARADASKASYQVRAQELKLQTDVATALQNMETAYQTSVLQERVRATAAEELRLAQERFRFGAASSIEVTDAQTNLAEAERAQIDAVYTFHKSLAALEALVGSSLR